MLTTIVLGTTAYSSDGTAYAGFSGAGGTVSWASAKLFGPRWVASDESYSTLEFTLIGCGPAAPLPCGLPVQVVFSNDDGSSPVVRFTGDTQRREMSPSSQGPAWSYLCTDLKKRSDYVALLGTSGQSVASYNLSPTDPLFLFNLAGKTVGQICVDVLQGIANATALSGLGVGAYVTLSPPTLPAATLADLALLTVVPPTPVQLQGTGILNVLQQFVQTWQSQYTLFVQADGTVRVVSIFGRPAQTLTLPSYLGEADPVYDLAYTDPDLSDCYTAVQVVGQDIAGAVLSFVDGTLKPGWTGPQQAAWTSASFTSPANDPASVSNDDGTLSSVTAANCVVTSAHPTVHWTLNYLSNNGGVIQFIWLAGTGINITETRQITSNTALTAGGSATVTWDASLPLSNSSYDHYRIFLTNSPGSLVDRKFLVAEPVGSLTGLATEVGSHMYPVFPFGFAWGNVARGATEVQVITAPTANVLWSQAGKWPWFVEPVGVDLDPTTGSVILRLPAVFLSASMAAQTAGLAHGYPSSFFNGLWYDVQVAVPYNRGDLNVRVPSSGFSGTANTKYGVERVQTIALSDFIYAGSSPSLATLAADHLLTVQDAVVEGSVKMLFDYWTPTFDPFALGYAIEIATPGGASDIDGLNLPVRSFTVEWPHEGANLHTITFNFNNRHRPFEGDALFAPHAFSANGWGAQQGSTFVGGNVGGVSGTVDHEQFAQHSTAMGQQSPGEADAGGAGGGDMGGTGFGMGDMGGMPQGQGLKRTENDTRREKRLEAQKKAGAAAGAKDISDTPAARHAQMANEERNRPQKEARSRAEEGRRGHAELADQERGKNRESQKQRDQAPKMMRAVDRAAEYRDSNDVDTTPPSMPLPGSTINPDDITNGGG